MEILGGSTDVTIYMHLRLAADGTDATGLTATDIDLRYVRTRAAAVTNDANALGAANSAHNDWGAFHCGNGVWRFDIPDAAFAAGVPEVIITAVHADIFSESRAIPIVAFNPNDGARLGLTSLPNANPAANGGLPTVDGNNRIVGIQGTITTLDALDTAQDTQHSTTQTAIADVPTNAELATALGTADDAVLSAIAALNNISTAQVSALIAAGDDATLAAIAALNNLSSAQAQTAAAAALTAYDPPTNAEMEARTLAAASYATASAVSSVQSDTNDIQTRLPAALVDSRMDCHVGAVAGETITGSGTEGDPWGPV